MTGFENCVVLKPWGHEFQVFDNGRVSVWMLCIKPGQGTSVHCHFGKTAKFVPISGSLVVRTNAPPHHLTFPQSIEVGRYEFHAVGNGGGPDLWLIEIETPSDKHDLFRLRDAYGRGQGYEGGANIVRDGLEQFGHFSLTDGGEAYGWACRFAINHGMLSIESRDHHALHRLFLPDTAMEAA